MSSYNIPNFPGDTNEQVEINHGQRVYWTSKQTVWSVVLVIIALFLSGLLLFISL